METTIKNPETSFFRRFIKSIPMATCGLALGFAALGNLLQGDVDTFGKHADLIRYICGGFSLAILLIFALKIVFDYRHAKEELKTSIPASVLPTSTMALMLLCTYVKEYLPTLCVALWYAAVIVQVCMMVYFFRKFIADLKLAAVFPSWFIVFVGIVVASVTAPAMGAAYIGQAAFYAGFIFYFVCLAMVAIRMIKIPHKLFAEPARPTIAIFTAPMSLLIVGYFNSFGVMANAGAANKGLIYFMLIIAALTYVCVLAAMVPLLLKRFYPTYSSFTFPLVISAIAFRLGAKFINALHSQAYTFLNTIANVTQWFAVAAVLFVLICYIRHFIYWLKF